MQNLSITLAWNFSKQHFSFRSTCNPVPLQGKIFIRMKRSTDRDGISWGENFLNASGHFSPSSSKQSLVRPFPFKSSEVRAARSTLSLSNEGWNAPSCFRLKGNMNCIHCRGYRDHVWCHVTFDITKPRKFGHWVNHPLPSYELRLRHFVVNNFQCREEFPCSKLTSFFLSYVWLFIKWVDISLPL